MQRAIMNIEGSLVSIYYELGGDECTLILSPVRAEQVRKGGVNIKISFAEGAKTACILGEEDLRGDYAVYTESYECIVGAKGVSARIKYRSGDDGEKINLKVRALAIQ